MIPSYEQLERMIKDRFYDQDPQVKHAIELLFLLPMDIQVIIAEAFTQVAENNFETKIRVQNYKSLGPEKTLALYKSKRKKRHYDQHPITHKAFNYLMIMDLAERQKISIHIVDLITCTQDYLKWCQKILRGPHHEELQLIADNYVAHGKPGAVEVIAKLQNKFNNGITSVQAQQSGFKVREEKV